MKILLVYPASPNSFWSFNYALQFISKKSCFPPLGLLTIAAMLPGSWEKKLIDMSITPLTDNDVQWADFVFISAMVIQKDSAREIIDRCKVLGVKTVAGGPLFTCEYSDYDNVDHLLLGEGELTIPDFIDDFKKGSLKHTYRSERWADLSQTPVPAWELIDLRKYATLNIQYSRGCPFNCEFCNVTTLFGHTPRTKSIEQLLKELDTIYDRGWRGSIFFVDDNFIGNRRKLKEYILPALIQWMEIKKYPFTFLTEVSINLADDEKLMELMAKAAFKSVFVGIETVCEDSLAECNKLQNKNRNMVDSVKKMQRFGLQVQGGFIVGFDSDKSTIFDRMINFIQESGVVTAMVGLLNAPKGTMLYDRLEREGRISSDFKGDNTNYSTNFNPKMNSVVLMNGYKHIINTIYSPKQYYERIMNFLKEYRPVKLGKPHFGIYECLAFFKANYFLGIKGKERKYYWKLFIWSVIKRPDVFPLAITLSIYGYHFRKIFDV
ncbi:B12-binding domain-containing radical SAM protein [Dehalobacter sp. DCM]|uniref:B12-binding domain-containing radical SAM protein n=1 Tax=Dehalobacter sp. DCM TaxID=2907827 RepID=UPI0030814E46|nr:B12-binding domain-containing radical SAM protein [Dehalobacter sp. DCM]